MTENQRIINDIKDLDLPVFIWGNGELAELSNTLLKNNGVSVEGRVVNVHLGDKRGNVLNKEELNSKYEAYIIIKAFLQVMNLREEEVKKIFGERCVKSYSLSELYSCYGIDKIDFEYAREHRNDFAEIYHSLEDNFSKDSFKAFLNAKTEEDSSYLYPYIVTPQYFFENNIWKFESDEVLFDAGAYDGDSIRDFLSITKNQYKRIIACEPDRNNMEKMKQYIKKMGLENINFVCKGVAGEKGILKYDSEGTMMSMITQEGKETILVDSIDNILRDTPVTIIKMDIEGYEKEALMGAKETIRRYEPMLCISAYHKKDDTFKIRKIIRSFSEKYRFYFRIHKPLAIDAVLYAVPECRLKK